MRLHQATLSLSLLVSLTAASKLVKTTTSEDDAVVKTKLPALSDVFPTTTATTTYSTISATATPTKDAVKPKARGSGDSPPDGKDGKPHDGPFVETNAERTRKEKDSKDGDKKGKDTGKGEPVDDPEGALAGATDGKNLPKSNDGVMNDKSGPGPKEGTRGTEGGVSQKNKDKTNAKEKEPERPKEMPPLPHSEERKMNGEDPDSPPSTGSKDAKKDGKKDETRKQDKILEKPADLPETPQKIPPPQSPGVTDHLKIGGHAPTTSTDDDDVKTKDLDIHQPFHSFVMSLSMILFSEIGDKTFLVAALMAMRHPRMAVFTAAFSALFTMTVLSALLGHAVPTLLPVTFTNFLAAGLFLVFGIRMIFEAKKMAPDDNASEEMKEVEMELEEKAHKRRRSSALDPYALEAGRAKDFPSPSSSSASSREASPTRSSPIKTVCNGVSNLLSLLLSPAWVQTFVMTFLAEWGDRSQIATIAMAAGKDYWFVTWGAVIGHAICTGAAVLGGRAIAGRVSMRLVTFGGAIAFLVFGIIYLYEAFAA